MKKQYIKRIECNPTFTRMLNSRQHCNLSSKSSFSLGYLLRSFSLIKYFNCNNLVLIPARYPIKPERERERDLSAATEIENLITDETGTNQD